MVLTSKFISGMDPQADTLKLLDEQSFEIQDSYTFKANEVGLSIGTVSFTDDAKAYIAVGTAFVIPEESEPKNVSLLFIPSPLYLYLSSFSPFVSFTCA